MSATIPGPADGEAVLHCGHFPESNTSHFHRASAPIQIMQAGPHGPELLGATTWIVVCNNCHRKRATYHLLDLVRGHGYWNGAAAALTAPRSDA
jgi:hypothetical protein